MTQIGFPIPKKHSERRRAILPRHASLVSCPESMVFETGYGLVLGCSDDDYRRQGFTVMSREDTCACPIICNPKPMVTDEYFQPQKTLVGWLHAVQGRRITDLLVDNRMTAIAWEDMFDNGRHVFWRNNELSGEAAIAQAFIEWGQVPYNCTIAVIGRGNVAKGATRALERAGAAVISYNRHNSWRLRHEIAQYDVIVNAVLWDVFRNDHLICEQDLENMKPGSLIIDISCDEGMGIETTRATTIENPVYWHKGIMHYAVDHTPTLYFRTATQCIGDALSPFISPLVNGEANDVLDAATIIRRGEILDERITRFQNRQER